MIGMDINHCQVVSKSLQENHPVNDQTMTSLGELQERLNYLKRKSSLFADVSFSPHVTELMTHMETVTVG